MTKYKNEIELNSPLPKFLTEPNTDVYKTGSYLVVDFETTNLSKGSPLDSGNRIVLAVWKYVAREACGAIREQDSYIRSAWLGEYELASLIEDVERSDFIVAHNSKFELGWLARCGLQLYEVLPYCTLLGEYVLGGNRWKFPQLSLETICQRRFGIGKKSIVSKMIKAGICPSDIPEEWLLEYCIEDVNLTDRLFVEQVNDLDADELLPIAYNRNLLTPCLADIETNGMQLARDRVESTIAETEYEYIRLQNELDLFTGGINLNSGEQLGEYIHDTLGIPCPMKKVRGKWEKDLTPTGRYKTDVDTIEGLRATNDKQRTFLSKYREYTGWGSSLSKYLNNFRACLDGNNGILIGNYNQANTYTHRLSATGWNYSCQFHNFPRVFKPLFTTRRPGWKVGEGDGSTLEFNTAVHQGRDARGLSDILDPLFDAHLFSAATIHGYDYNELYEAYKEKEAWANNYRQGSKEHTFKPLYGGSSGTEDEKRYYSAFKERYEGISSTQTEWINEVLETKRLITEWGMRYYWPYCKRMPDGYVTNSTSICNYPVQALATAEIIPIALCYFWHRLKRTSLLMMIVNTVHDSIICELPEEEEQAFHELCKQCLISDVYYMLDKLYGIKFTVPLGAGVKVGDYWSEGEEKKYTADKELWYENAKQEGMIDG